ncbi:MAG: TIGR03545 family protein [Bdellovibrionota bacterium]
MTDTNQPQNDSKNNSAKAKVYKEGGLIRWSAIIPFVIVMALGAAYFKLFFDSHMKAGLEWAGYKALGTEVNIGNFETSFIKGNVAITGLEITSAEQPDFNSIELGSIRFDVNWDALLRLKFVVEEMSVENVQFMSKRKYRGKVAPPPPPSEDKPGLASQVKDKAIGKIDEKGKGNLLGDLSAFLQTGDYKAQLANIESQLLSKKMANDLKAKWATKQTDWDAKLKALPKESDFKSYKVKFDGIKVKDFKTPQELDASVKQFNALKSEVDAKLKLVNDTKNEFNADLVQIKKDYQGLDEQIKADVASIKDRLKIPKIDSKQIAKSIFMDYLTPYLRKLDKVNELAEKYLPPKYSKMVNENLDSKTILAGKKKKPVEKAEDDTIQPHPRAEGVTYEFPVKSGYPLFWIQNIKVSSKSNAQVDYGDISGVIQNIVSNQRQIGKQTEMHIAGDFKSKNIQGLKVDAYLNNLKDEPAAGMDFAIASYPLQAIELMKNTDGQIAMQQSSINIAAHAATVGFKTYNVGLTNVFNNVQFNLAAKEKVVEEILKNAFSQLTSFDLKAEVKGELSSLDVDVSSSLGDKLQDALSASIKLKVDELNKEIKLKIDNEIGKVKGEIEKQIGTLTKGYLGNANDTQAKLDAQKNIADEKIAAAKKDLENKAKSQLQDKGKKALDDLKKKMKF